MRSAVDYVALLVVVAALVCLPGGVRAEKTLRIIGGNPAEKNEYSDYVLLSKTKDICGGSLIAKNLVLTAAHCVFDENLNLLNTSDFTAAKGPNLRLDDNGRPVFDESNGGEGEGQVGLSGVKKLIPHPKYAKNAKAGSNLDDIAIIVLNETLPGPLVTLAEPGASRKLPTGTTMKVIGFGYNNNFPLQPDGEKEFIPYFPNRLYEVSMSLGQAKKAPCDFEGFNNKKQLCLIGNKTSFPFPNEELELVKTDGFKGSCKGDSGGPLYYDGVQYGVVSFGRGLCAEFQANPIIFSKVSANRKYFIDPIIKEYSV
ncbi:hypothetical protein M9434_003761 [Picochlorum sp. BPE23]|nr:hypothetical protein M9434_003761 [Picochlorum sp. BPE23]